MNNMRVLIRIKSQLFLAWFIYFFRYTIAALLNGRSKKCRLILRPIHIQNWNLNYYMYSRYYFVLPVVQSNLVELVSIVAVVVKAFVLKCITKITLNYSQDHKKALCKKKHQYHTALFITRKSLISQDKDTPWVKSSARWCVAHNKIFQFFQLRFDTLSLAVIQSIPQRTLNNSRTHLSRKGQDIMAEWHAHAPYSMYFNSGPGKLSNARTHKYNIKGKTTGTHSNVKIPRASINHHATFLLTGESRI